MTTTQIFLLFMVAKVRKMLLRRRHCEDVIANESLGRMKQSARQIVTIMLRGKLLQIATPDCVRLAMTFRIDICHVLLHPTRNDVPHWFLPRRTASVSQ